MWKNCNILFTGKYLGCLIILIYVMFLSCGSPGGGRYEVGNDDNADRANAAEVNKENKAYFDQMDSLKAWNDSLGKLVWQQKAKIDSLEKLLHGNNDKEKSK